MDISVFLKYIFLSDDVLLDDALQNNVHYWRSVTLLGAIPILMKKEIA